MEKIKLCDLMHVFNSKMHFYATFSPEMQVYASLNPKMQVNATWVKNAI